MKSIIFDTDMGVDCDDAVALGILINEEKRKNCKILAITASTTRTGAVATIKTICKYYGVPEIPVGVLKGEPLVCDAMNNYAKAVMQKYDETDEAQCATALLRKTLAKAVEKVDIVAVGPLTNIKNLLASGADEFSPLGGIELVKEKVGKIYLMGGAFLENYKDRTEIFGEWNIMQDVPSARYVAQYFPCEMLYCPHEVGQPVKTKMQYSDNPVWFSMKAFALSDGQIYEPAFYRQSWDPITCLAATREDCELFSYSAYGKIEISENGRTHFKKEAGNHRFMLVNEKVAELEKLVNECVERF